MIPRSFLFGLILSVALAGCGKSKKTETATVDEIKPKYGGTLIYAKNGPPITLDPAFTRETESSLINDNIFDGLIEQRAGRVAFDPGLAKSWNISPDGKVYTFHLRTNVLFHDGTPFNAEAVLFNFERQSNPKHPYRDKDRSYEYWKNFDLDDVIKSMRVVDDSTIEVTLNNPDATFINILSLSFLDIVSPTAKKKFGKDFERNPVGTGPFKFIRWEDDGTVVCEAFKDYWNGRPYIDTLVLKPIPDARTRWEMLRDKQIDMMGSPNQSDIADMDTTKGVVLARQPGVNVGYLAMNTLKKPLDNLKVRQAIVYAINREKLVKEVYGDMGRPAKNPIPPLLLGHNDEIRFTPFDPSLSKQLLSEAGYPRGLKLSLWTMTIVRDYMPDGMKAAKMIQNDLSAVGIETEIVAPAWQDFLKRRGMGEHDLSISGWVGDAPDPHFFFNPLLDKVIAEKKPSTNAAFYRSQEMHDLIVKGKETFDPLERSQVYKKACEVFNQDLPWFVIAHAMSVVPMRDYVRGFQMHSSSVRKFNRLWLTK